MGKIVKNRIDGHNKLKNHEMHNSERSVHEACKLNE
jgi:hypothetical protein